MEKERVSACICMVLMHDVTGSCEEGVMQWYGPL
jgi:hypothetical protein